MCSAHDNDSVPNFDWSEIWPKVYIMGGYAEAEGLDFYGGPH